MLWLPLMADPFFLPGIQSPNSMARTGTLSTAHGKVETPVFMPVGTAGSVKAVVPRDLIELGAQIILGNAYHLYLRPGLDIIKEAGGLHPFINWQGPMLTDSGGFQVWSLKHIRKITEDGVEFASHIDGSRIFFSPENVMESQQIIGADIIMAFDECIPYPCSQDKVALSVARTFKWTKRAKEWLDVHPPVYGHPQRLFGIIQGGMYKEERKFAVEQLIELDLPGYAAGGLSVGEPIADMYSMTEYCMGLMPAHKPRYVMGVGTPKDLLTMIGYGVDMFDCVIPTRNARNGMVWTWEGVLHYKAARYAHSLDEPLDSKCSCYTCRNFSRGYLRHLFKAHELAVFQLSSIHNLQFFCDLMKTARDKICLGEFETWSKILLEKWEDPVP